MPTHAVYDNDRQPIADAGLFTPIGAIEQQRNWTTAPAVLFSDAEHCSIFKEFRRNGPVNETSGEHDAPKRARWVRCRTRGCAGASELRRQNGKRYLESRRTRRTRARLA